MLTPMQPVGFGVSSYITENTLEGYLFCVAVDASGAPIAVNPLRGTAAIEYFDSTVSPPLFDVAKYSATGIRAISDMNDGDNVLVLGGPQAEYEGCPQSRDLAHFFDQAIEPASTASTVFTRLPLTPCT